MFFYLFFLFLQLQYSSYRNQLEDLRKPNVVYETLDVLDSFWQDLKMRLSGDQVPTSKVALVAIDDESIREIGRWPWDRQTMARLIDNLMNYEPRAVGLDVIFSEPQTYDNGDGDQILKQVIEKHQNRLILGTFAQSLDSQKRAYQDYCMNEAFIANNGESIAKLNPNLVLNDEASEYESLNLQNYFQFIFKNLNHLNQERFLESKKYKIDELNEAQRTYLNQHLASERENYCRLWLTEKDPFLDESVKDQNLKKLEEDLRSSKLFPPEMSLEDMVKKLKRGTAFHPLPESVNWTSNIDFIQNASLYSANFNAYLDPDGKVRRMPMVYRTGNRLGLSFVPSLALQTYLVGLNYRAEVHIKNLSLNSKSIDSFKILDQESEKEIQSLPVDLQGRVKVNFYGPTYSVPHIPARELLNNSDSMQIVTRKKIEGSNQYENILETVNKKDFLKDSLLIIGATAVGVYDLRNTPLEKNFPGPEIHTHLLSNLKQGNYLKVDRANSSLLYIIGFIFIFLYILSFSWTGALGSGAVFVGALLTILIGDYLFYIKEQSILPFTIVLVLFVAISYFVLLTYKFLTEEKNKKELKGTFAKYVSPAIVDEILKSPDKINLGGEKKEVSIFFSDVRGFTTLSEKLDPQKLSDVLNFYLTPMTNIILEKKGTLDKYIGDAIMAFFGAPLPDEDHAYNACQTALLHVERLKSIQESLRQQGIEEFDIGIGINCGEVSVGNMGSNLVRNYTVMGDAVNLASRLEGITKVYGVRIVVSEFIYKKVSEGFIIRKLDAVRVKGKLQPIQIYELMDFVDAKERMDYSWLEFYEKALSLYFAKDFDQALVIFEQLKLERPDDKVLQLYIERVREYQIEPPSENWDGVFEMKTK